MIALRLSENCFCTRNGVPEEHRVYEVGDIVQRRHHTAEVNSAIIVEHDDANGPTGQKSRLQFEGFTVGGGFDIKFGKRRNQKANVTLLVPIRDRSFWWYRNHITNTLGGTIKQDVFPVLIAAGWNIDLLNVKRN